MSLGNAVLSSDNVAAELVERLHGLGVALSERITATRRTTELDPVVERSYPRMNSPPNVVVEPVELRS
jgi:hypothetical protein